MYATYLFPHDLSVTTIQLSLHITKLKQICTIFGVVVDQHPTSSFLMGAITPFRATLILSSHTLSIADLYQFSPFTQIDRFMNFLSDDSFIRCFNVFLGARDG